MNGVEEACVEKGGRSDGCEPSSDVVDVETTVRDVSDVVTLKKVDYIMVKKYIFDKCTITGCVSPLLL